jgi:hypothetical protein
MVGAGVGCQRWSIIAAMRLSAVLVLVVAMCACGGRPPPPPRGVVETDVGDWRFRRFQEVLDVEVWIEDNRGVAYAATYDRDEAEKINKLTDGDIATAFVTRYDHDDGVLRETVKFIRRLAQDAGYDVEEKKIAGVRCVLITGHDEAWVMWAAPKSVVKIGGRNRTDVPSKLVGVYGARYPSQMSDNVLEGPLPPGPEPKAKEDPDDEEQPYDPDNPTPDWDAKHPDKGDKGDKK